MTVPQNPADASGFVTRRELRSRERAVPAEPIVSRARMRHSRPAPGTRRAVTTTTRRETVRTAGARKLGAKRLQSFAAMVFCAMFAVGLSVPANALYSTTGDTPLTESLAMDAQSLEIDPTSVSFADRDAWTVTSWAQMLRLRYGNRTFDYTIGSGAIRWPFPVAIPISSGFGARAAPCQGCSTNHSGLDFASGADAAIFSVADGVVVERSTGGTTWGNYVVIESTVDGQKFQAGYAHMAAGSSALQLGEVVKVGDLVGLTGATGQVSGAHLHFTIKIDGSFVDPFTFLKRYAS